MALHYAYQPDSGPAWKGTLHVFLTGRSRDVWVACHTEDEGQPARVMTAREAQQAVIANRSVKNRHFAIWRHYPPTFDEPAWLGELPVTRGTDPRDPRPGVTGFWAYHNCWACKDGSKPCRNGAYNRCDIPHARND